MGEWVVGGWLMDERDLAAPGLSDRPTGLMDGSMDGSRVGGRWN